MSEDRVELIEKANALGLSFHSNIPTEKLRILILEATGEPIPVDEEAPEGPAVKVEVVEEEAAVVEEEKEAPAPTSVKGQVPLSAHAKKRKKIADAKARAMKTQVVTITNKDNRENDVMTTVYLSFENQYFGLSKLVPLDVPVELEQALIDIAASTAMTLHKDEIVGGKRTGNKVSVRTKKFAISYGRQPQQ
jgi:hypothetical protein